ncbi:hypothetical protein BCV69DRAFT_140227 [Microstroma glucosiphilum]|uniref:Uncharacterized protein n=1 Tax=Pseudomicrostroma glucosiphilum TaxID=1684307 RepID=A0A316UD11_9BASI|nr:hypothetical protein BCV69DRAFT_140227 [Pseudomicrostroma glucosiphilum]PWN22301.1 hypothetical protein BCV69DRAFT_140227 [Pseudomicrostroma glucosiphilum]
MLGQKSSYVWSQTSKTLVHPRHRHLLQRRIFQPRQITRIADESPTEQTDTPQACLPRIITSSRSPSTSSTTQTRTITSTLTDRTILVDTQKLAIVDLTPAYHLAVTARLYALPTPPAVSERIHRGQKERRVGQVHREASPYKGQGSRSSLASCLTTLLATSANTAHRPFHLPFLPSSLARRVPLHPIRLPRAVSFGPIPPRRDPAGIEQHRGSWTNRTQSFTQAQAGAIGNPH